MSTVRLGSRRALGRRVNRERGQALLIAVLLMSVILLVGILFAAVVSYNQEQSARHLDLVAAQLQAEAGINYASGMLERSPQGADWRPRFVPYTGNGSEDATDPTTWPKDPATWPNPPARYEDGSADFNFYGPDGAEGTEDDYYSDFEIVRGWFPLRHGSRTETDESKRTFMRMGFFRFPDPNQVAPGNVGKDAEQIGRGYFFLQVTYDPDPPYEPGDDPSKQDRMSGNTRIVSIGRSEQESNVFRRLVAYKPIGLLDNMRWVTNKSGAARSAAIGLRASVNLSFLQGAATTLPTSGLDENLYTYLYGPLRSAVPLYWAGQKVTNASGDVASLQLRLRSAPASGEGYLRDDYVLAPRGLYWIDDPDSATPNDGAGAATVAVNGTVSGDLPDVLEPDATSGPSRVYVKSTEVPPLAPVDLDARDPLSGVSRYQALTRESGQLVAATDADGATGVASGDPVNTGLYGGGAGMYVNNVNDVQYRGSDGRSNLAALQSDWVKTPAGVGQLGGPGEGGQTSWNATFTTYTPPGVEIEFFPSEEAVLATCTSGSSSGTPPATVGTLWWPNHTAGAPGIKITRHDQRWRRAQYDGGSWHVGEDSGQNVMVIDYPRYPNQVILAEGNVRVKGILPARDPAAPELNRTFDVTVVSNATIYIDGQLMTAQDVHGRRNDTIAPVADGVLDEDTAKVALLAGDNVCLNPTQLVPQLTSGLVTAAADDKANPTLADQHLELFPDATGYVYSQWRLGWPDVDSDNDGYGNGTPGTPVAAGTNVYLTPIHAADEPGPSGMSLTTYQEGGASAPFRFSALAGILDPYAFIFLPATGAIVPAGVDPLAVSRAVLPSWQTPGSTPANRFTSPAVPFDVTTVLTKAIGETNAVTMAHRDPQIGAGSTPYLVKKWKIEECFNYDAGGGTFYQIPMGAIHAKINALMYAQRGCWFVIPGTYFDPEAATESDYDGDGTITPLDTLYAARFRRYNYEITVRGTITEDHTAPLEAQEAWMVRWAYPVYSTAGSGGLSQAWGSIRYQFDERLRIDRDQPLTALNGTTRSASALSSESEGNLPKLPCLPSSPTLIYTGGTP